MANVNFVAVPGSTRTPLRGAVSAGDVDGDEETTLTLIVRRRADLPRVLVEGPGVISVARLAAEYGADPADLELVRRVLERHGLTVVDTDPGTRRVKVRGPISKAVYTFGAILTLVESGSGPHARPLRVREGGLHIPAELEGILVAVLGFDQRPQATSKMRLAKAAAGHISFTPPQVGTAYKFPAGTDGTGHTIAILELGGGFAQTDLDAYFSGLGIVPTPSVTAVGIDGAVNVPGKDPSGADGEVLLDIEVVGSLAPGAAQLVYFAPNTDQGFLDALATASHATPTPIAVSISWGGPEDSWTQQARTAFDQALADAAALGVTFCVASGDGGSSDGQTDGAAHVDFPAASPHALACGGTRLALTPAGAEKSETVWNDGASGGATGGGISKTFPQPAWQAKIGVPPLAGGGTGRGVPDVAGNADPASGYKVRIDGTDQVIGGTSAVAPLWAALVCRLAQAVNRPLGLLQPVLYGTTGPGVAPPGFRDITTGNNGAYKAGPGWDPCTGLGVPDGEALVAVLRGAV